MASLNRVLLMGNLTRDPEIRFKPGNTAVGDLRLAVSRKFKTTDGTDREEVCYVTVVVWGRQAETCGEYLSKGSPILVEGRLQYDEWEKDGQKQNRLRVVAERVQFLGTPRKGARAQDPAGAPEPVPARDRGTVESTDQAPVAAGADDDNLPF
ncbi:MAG: hypothetical protein A2498_02405 [Lentisphaerae bacterium RIFOXYC12_FULL_60_16]|nr:MAG: hypothetical protein A2498_02405 [Lentisphaerae bacterium RIFOXYC12_FULL_60_16]OGV74480.1 MAG: hypothetical protein A2269_06690 [Lentisphaerae bacterium RIFOXYA12_FULL_60_10]